MPAGIIESFFLIFFGASVLAALALFSRQPLIVAYVVTGCLLGPHALGWVDDPDLLIEISRIGIIFLLFLIGLDLPPNKLKNMLRPSIVTVLLSSVAFFGVGFGVLYGFGFSRGDAIVGGVAAMFSSTVMGLKLLPMTVLHHRHTGEIVISLLLLQDLIAVVSLIVIAGYGGGAEDAAVNLLFVLALLPVLVALAFVGVRYLIVPLIKRFDAFHEFIFLLAIGWCLALATLAHSVDLSFEIGAFVAGVSLANSPIAHFITLTLRPLRDFFLVLFFFSVGASIDLVLLLDVIIPTVVLAVTLVILKPLVFHALLRWGGENASVSTEIGMRLGQASEFSLLVTYVAGTTLLTAEGAHVIQGATVITLLLSTYLVIFRYPSPIAVSARLRRD